MSAVLALLHDVCIMLAVYAIFRVPLNNSFITAILIILGYSINDTIGRSVSISFTTIIMVVLLFILGTDSVRESAFPLVIGITAGTYFSIFVASLV